MQARKTILHISEFKLSNIIYGSRTTDLMCKSTSQRGRKPNSRFNLKHLGATRPGALHLPREDGRSGREGKSGRLVCRSCRLPLHMTGSLAQQLPCVFLNIPPSLANSHLRCSHTPPQYTTTTTTNCKMLATLLTTTALATTLVNAAPISPRQDVTCSAGVHIIHARGSTQSQEGDATLPVVERLLSAIPGSSESDVDYPAVIVSDTDFYSTSVADGIDNLISQIESYVDACGDESRIVLLGFSQGGNVISSALAGGLVHPVPLSPSYKKYSECDLNLHQRLHLRSDTLSVKGAAVFGDPTHRAGRSYNAGDADGSGIFKRIWPSLPLLNYYADVYRDYCAEGDFFCDAGGSLEVHSAEVDMYGDDAADWIIGLLGQ